MLQALHHWALWAPTVSSVTYFPGDLMWKASYIKYFTWSTDFSLVLIFKKFVFPFLSSINPFPVFKCFYSNIIAQCINYLFSERQTPPISVKFPSPTDAQQNSPSSGLADWMTMSILGIFLFCLLGGICLCIFLKKFRVFGGRCPFCRNWPSLSAREPARVYVVAFAQWIDTRLYF